MGTNYKIPVSAASRLRKRLVLDEATGCLNFTGPLDRGGYARVAINGRRNALAHRVAYEAAKGEIPDGLHLDHLCRNRRCCNPDHLEPVTIAENNARSRPHHRQPTHCKRGHEFTPENTHYRLPVRLQGGLSRACRACRRDARSARTERERAAREPRADALRPTGSEPSDPLLPLRRQVYMPLEYELAEAIEPILFRRALDKRLDGYTLETAQEIANVIAEGLRS